MASVSIYINNKKSMEKAQIPFKMISIVLSGMNAAAEIN